MQFKLPRWVFWSITSGPQVFPNLYQKLHTSSKTWPLTNSNLSNYGIKYGWYILRPAQLILHICNKQKFKAFFHEIWTRIYCWINLWILEEIYAWRSSSHYADQFLLQYKYHLVSFPFYGIRLDIFRVSRVVVSKEAAVPIPMF